MQSNNRCSGLAYIHNFQMIKFFSSESISNVICIDKTVCKKYLRGSCQYQTKKKMKSYSMWLKLMTLMLELN